MKYATIGASGNPTGFFDDSPDWHGPREIDGEPNPDCKIPLDAVPITDAQHQAMILAPGGTRLRLVNDKIEVEDAPKPPKRVEKNDELPMWEDTAYRVAFNQENRIRALENLPPLTGKEFRIHAKKLEKPK